MNDEEVVQQVLVIMNAYPDGASFDLAQILRKEIFKSNDAVYLHIIEQMERLGYVEYIAHNNYRITITGRNAIVL